MLEIKELLKENEIKPVRYEKNGKAIFIKTDKDKLVLKKKKRNEEIFSYLESRNFNYYPHVVASNDEYEITEYIDEIPIPTEQKMQDLIDIVSLLHNKTTFYKEIDISDNKEIYEDINNNINYLNSYYDDIMTIIESKVYMSPSEYLLARNISKIYFSLYMSKQYIDKWYEIIKNEKKQRNVVLHNNLEMSHFIRNKDSFLLNWEKAKIDLPIFDIYKLYTRHSKDFDFEDIYKRYEKNYPLLENEKYLLYSLLLLPDKIEFKKREYELTKEITILVNKLTKINNFVSPQNLEKRT